MAKRSHEDFDPQHSEDISESSDYPGTPADANQQAISNVETKIVHLDPEMDGPPTAAVMRCSLPGHQPNLPFTSFDDYDVHYNKYHVNRCISCCKNFPTSHFLSLHQSENHDPLAAVLKDRGEKTYGCFVEGCDKKCSAPQKRRLHLIDKHMFPKNYDFFVVNDGIDWKTSMLRPDRQRRRSLTLQKKAHNAAMSAEDAARMMDTDSKEPGAVKPGPSRTGASRVQEPAVSGPATSTEPAGPEGAMEIDDLAGAISALRFVPSSVRFGRGKGCSGFSKS